MTSQKSEICCQTSCKKQGLKPKALAAPRPLRQHWPNAHQMFALLICPYLTQTG
ncbi:UNVERIFIED_CONTAM: hypothetical protein GTU68_024135 [Idotea baltica]|nr:hypothetical protein [Idotea baltica]